MVITSGRWSVGERGRAASSGGRSSCPSSCGASSELPCSSCSYGATPCRRERSTQYTFRFARQASIRAGCRKDGYTAGVGHGTTREHTVKKRRKTQRHPPRVRAATAGEHYGSREDPPAQEPERREGRPTIAGAEEIGRRLGLVSPPGGGAPTAGAQVVPLGYIDGLLWRLIVLAPLSASGDAIPQLQHQHPGSGEWEVVAHDDLLAHITWRAYRRGTHRAGEAPVGSGLLIPGSPGR